MPNLDPLDHDIEQDLTFGDDDDERRDLAIEQGNTGILEDYLLQQEVANWDDD